MVVVGDPGGGVGEPSGEGDGDDDDEEEVRNAAILAANDGSIFNNLYLRHNFC